MSVESDEDFVVEVVNALDRRMDENRFGPIYRPGGLRNFTEPERVVLLAEWSMGIIQNGGFQFFYEGATNAAEVADAYERLGYAEAAEACRASLYIFPDGIPPEDVDQRSKISSAYEGAKNEFLRPLNEAVWEAGDTDFAATLAGYIRAHETEFRETLLDL